MTPRHKRLMLAAIVLGGAGVAVALVLNAFNSNLVFFYSPSDVAAQQAPQGRTFRIGGLVEQGSVKRQSDGVTVRFVVTDTAKVIPVEYRGILPDLFKEGKGVVAQGKLEGDGILPDLFKEGKGVVAQGKLEGDGIFRAQEVLAKHDENYMPPEAASALERAQKAQTSARNTMPALPALPTTAVKP